MQWLSFTKVKKINVEIAKLHAGYEPFNGLEDREEVPGDRKHPWPITARKKTECPFPWTPQKHEGKAATKPSPLNGSYPAVLQFQHYFFHFYEA